MVALVAFLNVEGRSTREQFTPPVSKHIDTRVLVANTAKEHSIPAGAKWVVFSANVNNFFVQFGTTTVTAAAVPAADITNGTAPLHSPVARSLLDLETDALFDKISLVAGDAAIITMEFYE